ncbi:MAG TPA: hypothetical protein VEC99_03520, partial [Clostridia bacterium]|nr:hypothetical protein [Clostridia bacterium]
PAAAQVLVVPVAQALEVASVASVELELQVMVSLEPDKLVWQADRSKAGVDLPEPAREPV